MFFQLAVVRYDIFTQLYVIEFLVVHNGIITNYRELKSYLISKGHQFESETDTEVIAKLIQHIANKYPNFSFRQLVETTIQQLVRYCLAETSFL